MSFKEDLLKLAGQVEKRKEYTGTEEATKNSLILPFLQVLGFDVFNPLEVQPEYCSAFGGAKNARVDYAILKDSAPIIFLEAKPVDDSLKGHYSQLRSYFNATPTVRVAIITNGVIYRFYTDLNVQNIMDDTSFLEINITLLSDADTEVLSLFKKEEFDAQKVVCVAEELAYATNLIEILEKVFREPNDDFIKYLLSELKYPAPKTSSVLDKFRPIVKKAIYQALVNLVQKGLASPATMEVAAVTDSADIKRQIVTTGDELKAFEVIKVILAEAGKDAEQIQYKDTTVYFSIFIKNPSNWIVRLNLDSAKKSITTNIPVNALQDMAPGFEAGEANKSIGISRVYINSIEDILCLKQVIIESYRLLTE
jgi:hypothetical protein